MKYNFDELIDRSNTDCLKLECCEEMFGTCDLLPMWVADMDFETPPFIFEAIQERVNHPVLGYTIPPKNYYTVIAEWIKSQHQWEVKEEWLGFLPGIVPGLSFSVQIFTELGDEVIIQPPVYHPFQHVIKKNGRKVVYNPLKVVDDKFEMDLDDLEKKITPKTKLLFLCNPHNPGGKVWGKEALTRLADICHKHGIIVVSDEIHADMTLCGYKHVPFASVSEKAAEITVTYMAPSKAFNMPGLISSYYVISNPDLKNKLQDFLNRNELFGGNIFAYAATVAAYQQGKEWLEQMLAYVKENMIYVIEYLKNNIPQIKPVLPEASFLIFLNCKDLGLKEDDLSQFFIHKAKLGLNDGRMFGPGGENHMRMNLACPRSIVEDAMQRLEKAVKTEL